MMSEFPPAIFLMGPTAAGKTALALALHDTLPVEIISVDSSQVYCGMDIGTAKPTRDELSRAPHRLIDIRDPRQAYSAADFCADALGEMRAITQAGKVPLLVGGTMFYFRALEFGLSDLPSADPDIRARLGDEAAILGWYAMHRRLQEIDPVSASQIHPNDAQRIQRALEIHELTGQPPSVLSVAKKASLFPFHVTKIALWPRDRILLHERIAARFLAMLERGFVEEVERLMLLDGLNLNLPSMRAAGYRQIWQYLIKTINYSEMTEQAIAATRQFAKRQITWLRSYPGIHAFDGADALPEKECLEYLRQSVRL
jgi:tRNA dimethylallyltransferase